MRSVNRDTIKGKWQEIKGEIQKQWGKLTDDELDQTEGDMTAIEGVIRQKYGDGKEEYRDKLNNLFSRYGTHDDDVTRRPQ
jgi:uncharacterized protein YjbJ (UPF0337 family)